MEALIRVALAARARHAMPLAILRAVRIGEAAIVVRTIWLRWTCINADSSSVTAMNAVRQLLKPCIATPKHIHCAAWVRHAVASLSVLLS